VLYWHRNADHDPANIWMRRQISEASRRLRPDTQEKRVKVRERAGKRGK